MTTLVAVYVERLIHGNLYINCKVTKFLREIVSFDAALYRGNFVAKQNVLCRKLNTTYT